MQKEIKLGKYNYTVIDCDISVGDYIMVAETFNGSVTFENPPKVSKHDYMGSIYVWKVIKTDNPKII